MNEIVLPATTMAFGVLGVIVRTARSAMLETINEPFFKTFMSYGFDNIEMSPNTKDGAIFAEIQASSSRGFSSTNRSDPLLLRKRVVQDSSLSV